MDEQGSRERNATLMTSLAEDPSSIKSFNDVLIPKENLFHIAREFEVFFLF